MESLNQKRSPRQNLKENSGGFTIIEVVLFLALSGLFMGIAFVGIQGRTASVQFTDSMRSLQSFLVSEQNKVLNGANSNDESACSAEDAGTNEDCVMLGRVINFGILDPLPGTIDLSKVDITVLYGDNTVDIDVLTDKSDLNVIKEFKPTPDGEVEAYSISWGTKFVTDNTKTIELTGPGAKSLHSIGWIRSPVSSRIFPIAYEEGTGPSDASSINNFSVLNPSIRIGDEVHTRLCFDGPNGRAASIEFGGKDGGGNITGTANIVLKFDEESGC